MALSFRHTGVFFGGTVSQSDPLEFTNLADEILITQGVLGPEDATELRSTLLAKVGAMPPVSLCSFVPGVSENAALHVLLPRGTNAVLTVHGPGVVHLAGRFNEEDEADEEMIDSDEKEEEEEVEEEEVEEEEEIEEEEEEEEKEKEKKRRRAPKEDDAGNNSNKMNEEEQPASSSSKDLEVQTMMIQRHALQFIDVFRGSGRPVRRGARVRVRYTGRFASNNRVFDTSGRKCISFAAGKGEVIRGLDAGVKGMMPGGKRKLFIPSELAYGAEGAPPDIPPNAALIFEVELVGYGKPKRTAKNQKRQSSPPRLEEAAF